MTSSVQTSTVHDLLEARSGPNASRVQQDKREKIGESVLKGSIYYRERERQRDRERERERERVLCAVGLGPLFIYLLDPIKATPVSGPRTDRILEGRYDALTSK